MTTNSVDARSVEQGTQSAKLAVLILTVTYRTTILRAKSAENDAGSENANSASANRCAWTMTPLVQRPNVAAPTLPRTTKPAEPGTRSAVCATPWQRHLATRSVRATRAVALRDQRLSKGTLIGEMVSIRPTVTVPLMTLTVRLS